MENNVKDRLISYLEHKGINKSEFGRSIGVSNAFVSSMRQSIQPDKVLKIATAYPDLNIEWLLIGRGDMIRGTVTDPDIVDEDPTTAAYETLLRIVNAYQVSTMNFQEQIDRLISIIEKGGNRTYE